MFDSNTWNHLAVSKQMSPGSFKNCYLQTISLLIQYKQDLVLKNPQWLIYHKTQPNYWLYSYAKKSPFNVMDCFLLLGIESLQLKEFTAKIGISNTSSLGLFNKLGFEEVRLCNGNFYIHAHKHVCVYIYIYIEKTKKQSNPNGVNLLWRIVNVQTFHHLKVLPSQLGGL